MNRKVTQEDLLNDMKSQVNDLNNGIKFLENMTDADRAEITAKKELIVAAVSEFNDRYKNESLVFYDEMSEHSDVIDTIYRLFNAVILYSDYNDRLDLVLDEDASYASDHFSGFNGELEVVLKDTTFEEDDSQIAFITFQLIDIGEGKENKLELSNTCSIALKKDGEDNGVSRVEYCW